MNPARWPRVTWVAVLFPLVMGLAVVGALGFDADLCAGHSAGSPERAACEAGEDLDAAPGRRVLVLAWAAGTLLCGALWAVTRPGRAGAPDDDQERPVTTPADGEGEGADAHRDRHGRARRRGARPRRR